MVGSTTSYRDWSIVVGTGTLTLPPNVTDTVVLLAANQTLTTKTLTAPTINGAAMSGTITGTPTFSGNVVFSGTPSFAAIDSTAHGAGSATAIGLLLASGTVSGQAGVYTGSNHLQLIGFGYGPGAVLGVTIGYSSLFPVMTTYNILEDGSGNMTIGSGTGTVTLTANQGTSPNPFILLCKVNGGGFQVNASDNSNVVAMALSNAVYSTGAGYTLNCAVFSVTSDSRLKPDFSPYPGDVLGELDAVRVGRYSRMGPPGRVVDLGSARIGLAAETLPPGAGEVDSEGWHHMRLGETIAWEIGVMQAMRGEIRSLQNEVAALRGCQND